MTTAFIIATVWTVLIVVIVISFHSKKWGTTMPDNQEWPYSPDVVSLGNQISYEPQAEPGNDWATVLRNSLAELDDMSLSLTDERIDELRDRIVDSARRLQTAEPSEDVRKALDAIQGIADADGGRLLGEYGFKTIKDALFEIRAALAHLEAEQKDARHLIEVEWPNQLAKLAQEKP